MLSLIVPEKKKIILGHNAHLGAKAFDAYFLHIIAVNKHVSLLYIVKTADKVYDGSFTGPGGAYQCDGFARGGW